MYSWEVGLLRQVLAMMDLRSMESGARSLAWQEIRSGKHADMDG